MFIPHVNAHQKVTSAEDFNKQVDRITHSVYTSKPLSTVIPVITQWAHEQSSHSGGMEVIQSGPKVGI